LGGAAVQQWFQVYNYVPSGLGYTVTFSSLTGKMNFEGAPTPPKSSGDGRFRRLRATDPSVQGSEWDYANYAIDPNLSGQFSSTTITVRMGVDNVGENPEAKCTVVSSDSKPTSIAA